MSIRYFRQNCVVGVVLTDIAMADVIAYSELEKTFSWLNIKLDSRWSCYCVKSYVWCHFDLIQKLPIPTVLFHAIAKSLKRFYPENKCLLAMDDEVKLSTILHSSLARRFNNNHQQAVELTS